MIQEAQEKIDAVDRHVESAVVDSQKGGEELKQASKHKSKGLKYFLTAFLGAAGGVIGGVLGVGVGAGVGAGAGVVVGHTLGSKLEKLNKLKLRGIKFRGPLARLNTQKQQTANSIQQEENQ